MQFRYNFYDLLTVRSNLDLSYIVMPTEFVRAADDCERWDLTVRQVPTQVFDPRGCRQIAYGLHFDSRADFLFSRINVFGVKICWGIRHLLGGETQLLFNHPFWLLCRYFLQVPFSSICQVSLIVKALLQLKLLLKGHTFLSGAAVKIDGTGIVFSGISGAGKTTALLNFLAAFRARFVSEDILFLANRRMYCFPSPIKKSKNSFGFTTLFYTLYHILPYHLFRYENPHRQYAGRFAAVCNGPEDIFFLERSPDKTITTLSDQAGLLKLSSLNNRVFLYFYERVLAAAAYIYPEMSLADLQRRQATILTEQLGTARFHVIRAERPQDVIALMKTRYENPVNPSVIGGGAK
jgi:hypothetical protein